MKAKGETLNFIYSVFNGIYDEVIGICKIASLFFLDNDLKKELFSFKKVVNDMNAAG